MSRVSAQGYLLLPWTIRGPFKVTDEHGNGHFEMRIAELPDFMVAGATESEALYEFRPALLAFLESYTSEGEMPTLPKGKPVHYQTLRPRGPVASVVRVPAETTASNPVLEPISLT